MPRKVKVVAHFDVDLGFVENNSSVDTPADEYFRIEASYLEDVGIVLSEVEIVESAYEEEEEEEEETYVVEETDVENE